MVLSVAYITGGAGGPRGDARNAPFLFFFASIYSFFAGGSGRPLPTSEKNKTTTTIGCK